MKPGRETVTATPESKEPKPATRPQHPARYSRQLMPVFAQILAKLPADSLVLDPMAGTGERLDELAGDFPELVFVGIEIEPAWIVSERVVQGDATRLPFRDGEVDCILVSPTYGNGMNDYFASDPDDASARNTYIHRARALTGNAGMEFGDDNSARWHFGTERYNEIHLCAWHECARVLRRGGRFILNTKNGVGKARRGGKDAADMGNVTAWHVGVLELFGLVVTKRFEVDVPGLRQGANADKRVGHEDVTVLRKLS